MIDDTIKNTVENEEPKAITEPIVKEPSVVDIDLGFVEKKRFRINGDPHRVLDLNVSDLNVFSRLKTGYPKLGELLKEAQAKINSIPEDTEDKGTELNMLADHLTDIDKKMRELIDYIFDANVSAVCAPSGNMFDPVDGQWRFERIIDRITTLYTNGLHSEFNKVKANVEKKTSKYTKKKR